MPRDVPKGILDVIGSIMDALGRPFGIATQAELEQQLAEVEQALRELEAVQDELRAKILMAQHGDDIVDGMSDGRRIATKDDGRDYQAETEAARAEMEGLWAVAQAVVAWVDDPARRDEVLQAVLEISEKVSRLMLSFPISDFEADPIPEGRELMTELSGFSEWLDEQYFAIRDGAAPVLHSRIAALERAA